MVTEYLTRRRATVARDVTAQCKVCHDFFDVTILNRRGELEIEPNRSCELRKVKGGVTVIHRPGHCDGESRVYWAGHAGKLFEETASYDPLAESKN